MASVTDEIMYAKQEAIQLASNSKLAENQLDGCLFKKPSSWFSASLEPIALFLQYNNSQIYYNKIAGVTDEILFAEQETIQLVFCKFATCCSISAKQQ